MVEVKHYLSIIKEEIKSAFKNNKKLLLLSILLFMLPALVGYFYPDAIADLVQPILDNFQKQVADGTIALSTSSLFTNNVTVAIMIYALTALGGILGAVILANNGLFVGFFGTKINIWAYLALTLPHGIFEIPAIIISATGGFVLLSFILHFIWNLISPDYSYLDVFDPYFSDVKISVKDRFVAAFKKNQKKLKESFVLLCVSVVLLIIAAFIEANITISLAQGLFSLFGYSLI